MKNKKNIKNWWKSLPVYERECLLYWGVNIAVITAILTTLIAMGVVPMECSGTENVKEAAVKTDTLNLPPRTNTGDTLYVLGKAKGKNRVYAMQPNGEIDEFKFQGVDRVNPGDTIIINMKHKFLMKNITQRNLGK